MVSCHRVPVLPAEGCPGQVAGRRQWGSPPLREGWMGPGLGEAARLPLAPVSQCTGTGGGCPAQAVAEIWGPCPGLLTPKRRLLQEKDMKPDPCLSWATCGF